MIKKTLAGFATAAMLLPVAFVTASPASAQSVCAFKLVAPDQTTTDGTVNVYVYWQYDGASIKASAVTIENTTGRSITVSTDRWQNAAGTAVDRGYVGEIVNGDSKTWYPFRFIPTNQNPYVNVSAYATTRPGMNNGVKVKTYTCYLNN